MQYPILGIHASKFAFCIVFPVNLLFYLRKIRLRGSLVVIGLSPNSQFSASVHKLFSNEKKAFNSSFHGHTYTCDPPELHNMIPMLLLKKWYVWSRWNVFSCGCHLCKQIGYIRDIDLALMMLVTPDGWWIHTLFCEPPYAMRRIYISVALEWLALENEDDWSAIGKRSDIIRSSELQVFGMLSQNFCLSLFLFWVVHCMKNLRI
jgi:hypothetical protein